MHINGTHKKEHGTFSTCHNEVIGIGLDLPSLASMKLTKNAVYNRFKHKGSHGLSRKGKTAMKRESIRKLVMLSQYQAK